MKLFTFSRGGIHPPEHKELSEHKTIQDVPLPDQVFINLGQHLGKPAKASVKKRSEVCVGDVIGLPDGFISGFVHSSVSGTVKNIEQRMSAIGVLVETVVIDVDKEKTELDYQAFANHNGDRLEDLDKDELLSRIQSAGVVGMGGATFPTHVKLSPPPDKKIDTIIINGAECEPYLTADHQCMLEMPEALLEGILIIQKILGIENTYIGIETNKPDAIDKLNATISKGNYPGIKVAACKTKYPQGGEKQLIQAILRKEVPSGKLPFDVGVLVQNSGTLVAIYEAVFFNKPLIDRVTTVTGFVVNPCNVRLKLGMTFDHVIQAAGGFKDPEKIREVINGGPMMGKSVRQMDVSVMKGTSGILCLSDDEFKYVDEGPCIRCGRCVYQCPMGLMPTKLAVAAQFKNPELLTTVMDCIECGTCSYVCPTNRQLVHWIRVGKTIFRNSNRS